MLKVRSRDGILIVLLAAVLIIVNFKLYHQIPSKKFLSTFSTESVKQAESVVIKDQNYSNHKECAIPIEGYEVSQTSQCVLPVLEPYNKDVMKFMKPADAQISCPRKAYTKYKNGVLTVIEPVSSVNVRAITRKPGSDWGVVLTKKEFSGKSAKLNEEFLEVDIEVSPAGEKIVEHHAEVVPKPEVLNRERSKVAMNYSVLMIGFDSTSAQHMRRSMPKVYEYLKDLGSYFLNGHSIVGDGTTAQIIAMLVGDTEEALPEARRDHSNSKTIDDWPFVFKEFHKHGYATMYSEDDANLNTFNYRLHGFKEPPSDHYSRTFWQKAPSKALCMKSIPQPSVHFSYIESFMDAYRSRPKFGIGFLSEISHNDLHSLQRTRTAFLELLKSLENKGYLEDTILIIFGDHGARFGAARKMIQLKLEERLPFLSITMPKSSQKLYGDLHVALRENSNILTSHFDIHATLQHILSYSSPVQVKREKVGSSLFRKISSERTCADCGIPEHFCPCLQLKEISVDHPHVRWAAQQVVKKINNFLQKDTMSREKCEKLSLKEIKSAHQNLHNPKMIKFLRSQDGHGRIPEFAEKVETIICQYHLLIETAPNDALFEATAHVTDGRIHIADEISRINAYGSQPDCIAKQRPYFRKFCLCKTYFPI